MDINIKKFDFDLIKGCFVKIPVEKNNLNNNLLDEIFIKTLKKFSGLEIIKLPENYILDKNNGVNNKILVSNGNFLFAFLIIEFIKKILLEQKKNLAQTEIYILDNNYLLTMVLIDIIYPYVNYLVLITDRKDLYKKKEQEIFIDCGLNMQISSYNKNIIKNADIIINTGLESDFAYAIKRGALYFSLDNQKKYLNELKIKRPDIFVFDKIKLYYKKKLIDNIILEMILFCLDSDFKRLFNKNYDKKIFESVKNNIKKLEIKISSFQGSG